MGSFMKATDSSRLLELTRTGSSQILKDFKTQKLIDDGGSLEIQIPTKHWSKHFLHWRTN
jgi:hypothetical protein